jgi:hypothetical protein
MSKRVINIGNAPNDGTGDPLRTGLSKVNENFTELYNTLGDGNNVISYASTAGISTLAQNLTGVPSVELSGLTNTGISTVQSIQATDLTVAGIVTATQFSGDGSQLTGVTGTGQGIDVFEDTVRRGIAKELNFAENIQVSSPDGQGRVNISVASSIIGAGGTGGGGIAGVEVRDDNVTVGDVTKLNFSTNLDLTPVSEGISTVSISFPTYPYSGITTADITNWDAAYGWGDHSVAGYITTSATSTSELTNDAGFITGIVGIATTGTSSFNGLDVTGASTFTSNVSFSSSISLGNNDRLRFGDSTLEIYSDGSTSYIEEGAGSLIMKSSSLQIKNPSDVNLGVFNSDGSVELWWNGSKKLETTSIGATVTGTLSAIEFIGIGSQITGITTSQIIGYSAGGGGGGSYTNSDVDIHLNVGSATTNQILSWDGSDYAWVADQTGGAGIGTTTFTYIFESSDDSENKLIPFVRASQSGGGFRELEVDSSVLYFNPSTNILQTTNLNCTGLTASTLSGDGSAVTNINAANISSGTVNVDRLASSGTPSNSTFLRGDGAWATPGGGEALFGTATNGIYLVDNGGSIGLGTTNPVGNGVLQVKNTVHEGSGVASSSFTASAGTPQEIDVYVSDFVTAEYTLHIINGDNYQAQKALVMGVGTTAYVSEYGVMYEPNRIVDVSVSMVGNQIQVNLVPLTGISGVTTYRFSANKML